MTDPQYQIPQATRLRYLERRRLELQELADHFRAGNWDAIRSIAHKVKGSSLMYGYADLHRCVCDLENAALRSDAAAALRSYEEMEACVSSMVREMSADA